MPDGSVRPYISAYDLIGAGCFPEDFVVAGTASEALYGLCESLYKPDMVRIATIVDLCCGLSILMLVMN